MSLYLTRPKSNMAARFRFIANRFLYTVHNFLNNTDGSVNLESLPVCDVHFGKEEIMSLVAAILLLSASIPMNGQGKLAG